jgi:hypothetical protein
MRKLSSTLVAAVALVALPHIALAPRARTAASSGPKNEIGVDLGAAYSHIGSGCTADCGGLGIGTPIDIRWGFMARGPLSFEPRFSLNYVSGLGSPDHDLTFNPDLNVIYRMGRSTARRGLYLTGGLGLAINNFSTTTGTGNNQTTTSTTATQLSLNAGVGKRIPMESNAWRVEGFLRYNLENSGKGLPSRLDIGARVGMSFWR